MNTNFYKGVPIIDNRVELRPLVIESGSFLFEYPNRGTGSC